MKQGGRYFLLHPTEATGMGEATGTVLSASPCGYEFGQGLRQHEERGFAYIVKGPSVPVQKGRPRVLILHLGFY